MNNETIDSLERQAAIREVAAREELERRYTDDDLMRAWWYGFMAARGEGEREEDE